MLPHIEHRAGFTERLASFAAADFEKSFLSVCWVSSSESKAIRCFLLFFQQLRGSLSRCCYALAHVKKHYEIMRGEGKYIIHRPSS